MVVLLVRDCRTTSRATSQTPGTLNFRGGPVKKSHPVSEIEAGHQSLVFKWWSCGAFQGLRWERVAIPLQESCTLPKTWIDFFRGKLVLNLREAPCEKTRVHLGIGDWGRGEPPGESFPPPFPSHTFAIPRRKNNMKRCQFFLLFQS